MDYQGVRVVTRNLSRDVLEDLGMTSLGRNMFPSSYVARVFPFTATGIGKGSGCACRARLLTVLLDIMLERVH